MEPVTLPEMRSDDELLKLRKKFEHRAIIGHPVGQQAVCRAGQLGAGQENVNIEAAKMYKSWDKEIRVEKYMMDDAEIVIASYGISARICKAVINKLRKEGIKIGMIRPMRVSPFPYDSFAKLDPKKIKGLLDVEMSIPAQMIWDVKHVLNKDIPVRECLRSGGQLLTNDQVEAAVRDLIKEVL